MKVGDLVVLSAYAEKVHWLSERYLGKVGVIIDHLKGTKQKKDEYYVAFTDKTTETFFRNELKYAK
tara:strand:- start:437 stop:634 length:198 start_codon:yes stop_codon:yes gene_type:complete